MSITIVMYHYVRELNNKQFPSIKGLSINQFRQQIDYLNKHYNIIDAEELLGCIENNVALPPDAALLTFDDGYIDHINHVFPVLDKLKLSALFFPPAKPIQEHVVLDVNKIHFILATKLNESVLINHIYDQIDRHQDSHHLMSNERYWEIYGKPNQFDSAEVIFIKRILQHALPKDLREKLIDDLFKRYVTQDESDFAQSLYMNTDHLIDLQSNGMYIGNHSYNHDWLDTLNEKQQISDIEKSLQFLNRIGSDTERWIMCYPFGGYNASLITLLNKYGCKIGLTTEVRVANLEKDTPLALPRLDTTDLPFNLNALAPQKDQIN